MADNVEVAALDADGLHELAWEACDAFIGDVLVASPADARGRGILLSVTRGGAPCDLSGATVYLVWRLFLIALFFRDSQDKSFGFHGASFAA